MSRSKRQWQATETPEAPASVAIPDEIGDDEVVIPAVDPVPSPAESNAVRAAHDARIAEIDREIAELQGYGEKFEQAREVYRITCDTCDREIPRLTQLRSDHQAALDRANQAYTAVQPRLRSLIAERAKHTSGL